MRKRIAFSIAVALLSMQASAVTISCEPEGGGGDGGGGPANEYTVHPVLTHGVLYYLPVGHQITFKLLSPGGGSVSTSRWSIVGDSYVITRDNTGFFYWRAVARGTAVRGDSYIKTVMELERWGGAPSTVTVSMDQSLPSGVYTLDAELEFDDGKKLQGQFVHNSTKAAAPAQYWELPDFFEIPDAAPGEVHTITIPGTYGVRGSLLSHDASNDLFYLTDQYGSPFTYANIPVGLRSYDLLVNVRPDAKPGTRTATITATLGCN